MLREAKAEEGQEKISSISTEVLDDGDDVVTADSSMASTSTADAARAINARGVAESVEGGAAGLSSASMSPEVSALDHDASPASLAGDAPYMLLSQHMAAQVGEGEDGV